VTFYAREVVAGRIVACRYVKLACQRHLRDLAEGPKRGLVWRPDLSAYYIRFFRFLRHSKGEWGGQRIELSLWQQFTVGSVFGWLRADGLRRFRTAYEEVPRKNGKSTKLAGVGLALLVADREPGAEIYSTATKREQARIIFDEARRMALAAPELHAKLSIFKLNLSIDATASKFEPLSSDDKTLDGLNPFGVLVDELHKHKSRALLDVLDTGMGARRQPVLWIITTAGDDNPESVYAQENAYAIQVLEGTVEDDSYFAFIATIDKDDRWDDPKAWAKANPNLGISVKLDDLQRQAAKAINSPAAQAAFKRLRLNVRTSAASRAIDMDVWARNGRGPHKPELLERLRGRVCYAGLDLSSKIDLSARVLLFEPIDDDPRLVVLAKFWMPADTVAEKSDRDTVQYQRWVDAGWIETTVGNVIDHAVIEAALREDAASYDLRSVAYDTWNATQLAVALAAEGVPMVEFVQGVRSYAAPTNELDALLLAERLDHGNHPVLGWMASNLKVFTDRNLNKMPSKKHSTARIDGMTALIMAIGRRLIADSERSVYETRGLTILEA
jgi:phage terminase large subunit-like protein